MKTAQKIQLARLAYRTVHMIRAIGNRTDRCVVTRGGVAYDLDLGQGIDFAIYLGNLFERSTRRALSELVLPSATVLDIGANVGAHTLHLAKCVGPQGNVLAFEPTEFAFRKLVRNLEINPDLKSRVSPYNCFLAAEDKADVPAAIYSSWPLRDAPQNSDEDFHAKHLGQAMPTKIAQARSIDSILTERGAPRVQLVKLDVDGFECEILRGAKMLLQESHPIFVMELAPYVLKERGASLAELLDVFASYDYRFYDERTKQRLPSHAAGFDDLIADGESMNVVARVKT